MRPSQEFQPRSDPSCVILKARVIFLSSLLWPQMEPPRSDCFTSMNEDAQSLGTWEWRCSESRVDFSASPEAASPVPVANWLSPIHVARGFSESILSMSEERSWRSWLRLELLQDESRRIHFAQGYRCLLSTNTIGTGESDWWRSLCGYKSLWPASTHTDW
jgi:hypothetical protein